MTGKPAAWLNLAWHFLRHMTTRAPLRRWRRGHDFARFTTAVQPEGYVALTAAERTAFPAFMKCVHCGLCALACTPNDSQPSSAWQEAWTFAAGASRSLDRAPLAAAAANSCSESAASAAVCPAGIPFPLLAKTIDRLAGAS